MAAVFHWTFDRIMLVVSTVVAVIAALSATYAAVSARQAKQQRANEIRPRPAVEHIGHDATGGGIWKLLLSNAGGQIIQGLVVAQGREWLYRAEITRGAHSSGELSLRLLGRTGSQASFMEVLVFLVQDVDRRWWDVVGDDQLDVAWASTADPDCTAWVDEHVPRLIVPS